MNSAVRGLRLASPVRLALARELGSDLDGAWWPHTASIARELPELIGALSTQLGQILDISVNWSSLEASPILDPQNRARKTDPGRVIGHQRLMMITGAQASANLLVVPCWTSTGLAVMVLRQAAARMVMPAERDTEAFRTAEGIVRAARTESALCARRLQGDRGLLRPDS
jgi:type IV secretory pathway TrbD component